MINLYDGIVYGSAVLGSLSAGYLFWDVRRELRKEWQQPAVRMDPTVIKQWQSEVIFNALKAGPKGARPGYQRIGDSK